MGNPLLDRKSPPEWLATMQVIDFKEKISFFERLYSALENELSALDAADYPADWADTRVSGQLVFSPSTARDRGVAVEIKARTDATLVCQRSLEAFRQPLKAALRAELLGPEEQGSSELDTWELEEVTFRPVDIVDEALVMELPLSPMQEISAGPAAVIDQESSQREGTVKPFADLRAQMDKFGDE
ncbi:MAG: YceD family protein [Pseudomonadota bacterium]